MIYLLHFFFGGGAVFGISSTVPACPDGGRINVHDIFTKITSPDSGHPAVIQLMRQRVQLFQESADAVLAVTGKITRPVYFISQSPDDHGGMVAMLANHVRQHPLCLFFINFPAQSAAAPGDLFPREDTETVAHP